MEEITAIVEALGLGKGVSIALVVVVSMLRAGAATLSKHVPDEKLGRFAKGVNVIGGNGKHAANQ